jgi:hypothetical protein
MPASLLANSALCRGWKLQVYVVFQVFQPFCLAQHPNIHSSTTSGAGTTSSASTTSITAIIAAITAIIAAIIAFITGAKVTVVIATAISLGERWRVDDAGGTRATCRLAIGL